MHDTAPRDVRDAILEILKQERTASIAALAERLDVSYEAVRQHVAAMESEGWVDRRVERASGQVGRPTATYSLTVAGDHLFPKNYDALASALVGAIDSALGPEALEQVLTAVTESHVRHWDPLLRGRTLKEKLTLLRSLYVASDQYMQVNARGGEIRLVERNCPFLNVALRNPALCSTSVSALSRLLGYQVVREERFQHGDARCVFRVMLDRPIESDAYGFQLEPDA